MRIAHLEASVLDLFLHAVAVDDGDPVAVDLDYVARRRIDTAGGLAAGAGVAFAAVVARTGIGIAATGIAVARIAASVSAAAVAPPPLPLPPPLSA
ncbi:hypothetical protein [Mesorhizobium sp. M1A.F.Ca.IN.022.06.1.1]|uniref:hypothetical protein n=1 Tax=Mesorhizobium sp. M1A.F.Ca.IN.022.06.1.1 TaxID=2493680 RepID=UPI001ABFA4AB|nr:hypothetical protein [Mesorhizobium sp. M1A.F.Ca.IN.022.06.1.1]